MIGHTAQKWIKDGRMVGGHGGRARKIEMERASERVLRVTHAAEREACVCVCVCVCVFEETDLRSRCADLTRRNTNSNSYKPKILYRGVGSGGGFRPHCAAGSKAASWCAPHARAPRGSSAPVVVGGALTAPPLPLSLPGRLCPHFLCIHLL